MNAMCGIERWGGLSALCSVWVRFPGALPQAGIKTGLWPSRILRQRRILSQRGAKALGIVAEIEAELVAANRELI